MFNTGRIKLHRSLADREWYYDDNVFRLFIHLLIHVNHKEKKRRGQMIKRGEIITSYESLSNDTRLTLSKLRNAIKKLEMSGEITRHTTNKRQRITLCNYTKYQDQQHANDMQNDAKETNKRQSNDKQTTTTKECKEVKEGKEEKKRELDFLSEIEYIQPDPTEVMESFEQAYKLYPKKDGKNPARKERSQALRSTSFEKILESVKLYRTKVKMEGIDTRFVPKMEKRLRDKLWNDDYSRYAEKEPPTAAPAITTPLETTPTPVKELGPEQKKIALEALLKGKNSLIRRGTQTIK